MPLPGARRIAGHRHGRLLVVRALAERKHWLRLLVDTGASVMAVSREAARFLGLDLAHPVGQRELLTAERAITVPQVRLSHLQVGGWVATDFLAVVLALPQGMPVDGLLGMDFYDRVGVTRVTLELDAAILALR